MKHRRIPIPAIVLLSLLVLTGLYFGIRKLVTPPVTTLTASGTIEAVSVVLSPEIGGKVVDVMVNEGDTVKTGDPLFRLDAALLQAQYKVAADSLQLAKDAEKTANAAYSTALANYQVVLTAARLESAAQRSVDWRAPTTSGYTLPGGSFNHDDLISAAEAELASAESNVTSAEAALSKLLADSANAEFVKAESTLLNARAAVQTSQDVLNQASVSNNTDLIDKAQQAYDDAKKVLDDAQTSYDGLKSADSAKNVISARLDQALALERLASAQDRLASLFIGENSLKVKAASATVDQTKAAVVQASQSVVVADANLSLLDVQIAKLTVLAPSDGFVQTRSVQPGEILAPGAAAITLAQLTPLTITVYIPEDQYGSLSIGQKATILADSFPGTKFNGVVTFISTEAEFTPRNVQTTQGRKSTVFAVKLQIENPGNQLKAGMPADVIFNK